MNASYEELVERVRDLAALQSPDEVERAIEATLTTLGERLVDSEARALAAELPTKLAHALHRGAYSHDFGLDELYARVARREAVERSFGIEHAQAVCRALAEQISADARTRLRKELTPPIAALFALPDAPEPVEAPEHVEHPEHGPHARRSTLSEGKPGSRHPLSESRLDRAQTHSVSRSSEPHAETKISSSRGPRTS